MGIVIADIQSVLLFYNIFLLTLKIAATYVGCYQSTNNCNAFVETSFTSSQCSTEAASISGGICYTRCDDSHYFLKSSSMTVDICVGICITKYGYKYAGLNFG